MTLRKIRNAEVPDIPSIMAVVEAAKGIMRSSGNLHQWVDGYPSETVILGDISNRNGFVVEDGDCVTGYFAFIASPEPTYSKIYDGEWLEDSMPYHVIHRIASTPQAHGIFKSIMDWCVSRDGNIRIDTHRDNSIMRHNILKYGFTYCGIIYLESGDERFAYQINLRNSSH